MGSRERRMFSPILISPFMREGRIRRSKEVKGPFFRLYNLPEKERRSIRWNDMGKARGLFVSGEGKKRKATFKRSTREESKTTDDTSQGVWKGTKNRNVSVSESE